MQYLNNCRVITVASEPRPIETDTVNKAEVAQKIFRQFWPDDIHYRECFMVMVLNRKNVPIGMFTVSTGGVTSTVVDPKTVFSSVLTLAGGTGIIVAHNHPSGNTSPSPPDHDLTKKLQRASEALEISFIDHIILTADDYMSFAEEGLL